ncbi:hypothetical protein JL722_3155 [Aureococcus anophagefferens]|nr:hypothetical protein JL722_3155 [Aureococcus anophagefferens]
MSDALSRLTQVLNELQDTGGLTANLKISRSGDLEIVVTNSDTSPVTPSAPAAPSPPAPAPQAECRPGCATPRPGPPPRDARGGGAKPRGARPGSAPPAAPPPRPARPAPPRRPAADAADAGRGPRARRGGGRRAAAEEAAEAPAAVAVAHGHGARRAEAAAGEPAAAPEAWWPLLRSLRDVAARSPQHDSWEEPEFIVQRRNAEHCRLLKSVSLSRDVCHGHGLVAVKDLEPGDRFFDVTALYVDGAAKKPGEGDCAACATGAHRRHTCGQGRSAGGGSYLPIDNSVYYELKAGPTHALTYFFNEDRRGDDCDAKLICEDPKNAAIVTWCPKAREISVVDKPTFITDVLPGTSGPTSRPARQASAVDDDTATAHFDGVHSRQFDSFVRQLNYYGFRKARRCTNRYVCMDYSIKSPRSSTA